MAWSFTDWQCGIGVIKDCVGVSPNWGNKKAFQNLVNDVVPMAQVLIIYGAAQISSSISENQMRAVNAIRCMLNSLGTNTWSLLAAGYQIGVYLGMKTDLEGYLDMGYEYVCTCLVDAQGLQEYMGQTPESIEAFSTCSEGGSNEKIAAEQARAAKDAAKVAAALKATLLAARNKTIKETVGKMKVIKDSKCDALAVTANIETCFAAVQRYSREYGLVFASKDYAYTASGGAKSTKNRTQRDAYTKAVNVRDGILAGGIYFRGAATTLKERFTDKGAFESMCYTQGTAAKTTPPTAQVLPTVVYGKTKVDACMKKFMTDNTIGGLKPILQKDARLATAKHECKTGNLASGVTKKGVLETKVGTGSTAVTTPPNCGVKYLGNGYVQYVDNLTVTCAGTGTEPILKGAENCFHDPVNVGGSRWLSRALLTRDMDEFRSVGLKADVDFDKNAVRCFNTNKTFTETGTGNCWGYKLGSQQLFGEDQFLWMAQPECGLDAAGKKIVGTLLCKQTNVPNTAAVCASKVKWFNGQICVPKFTWVKK